MDKVIFEDIVAEHIHRYRLDAVDGQDNVYDIVPIRGTVTKAGTPIRAAELNAMQGFVEEKAQTAANSATAAANAKAAAETAQSDVEVAAANAIDARNGAQIFADTAAGSKTAAENAATAAAGSKTAAQEAQTAAESAADTATAKATAAAGSATAADNSAASAAASAAAAESSAENAAGSAVSMRMQLIQTVTTTEEVAKVTFDKDADGEPLALDRFCVIVDLPSAVYVSNGGMRVRCNTTDERENPVKNTVTPITDKSDLPNRVNRIANRLPRKSDLSAVFPDMINGELMTDGRWQGLDDVATYKTTTERQTVNGKQADPVPGKEGEYFLYNNAGFVITDVDESRAILTNQNNSVIRFAFDMGASVAVEQIAIGSSVEPSSWRIGNAPTTVEGVQARQTTYDTEAMLKTGKVYVSDSYDSLFNSGGNVALSYDYSSTPKQALRNLFTLAEPQDGRYVGFEFSTYYNRVRISELAVYGSPLNYAYWQPTLATVKSFQCYGENMGGTDTSDWLIQSSVGQYSEYGNAVTSERNLRGVEKITSFDFIMSSIPAGATISLYGRKA